MGYGGDYCRAKARVCSRNILRRCGPEYLRRSAYRMTNQASPFTALFHSESLPPQTDSSERVEDDIVQRSWKNNVAGAFSPA